MAKQRYLKNAPIIEALIDIQVRLPAKIDVLTLKAIHSSISQQYPKEQERLKGSFELKIGKSPEATTKDVSHYGYSFSSTDDKQIVQIRLDGFTFSRLKPYETWKSLQKEADRLWNLYVKLAYPELITRVALRYINRLEIPLPFKDFGEYITAPPAVPPNLSGGISSFLTRIVMPDPKLNATTIITQALEPIIGDKVVSIILDIDVFKTGEFNPDGKEAWETISQLRHLKNKIFFESIAEEMAKLCE
jgi:uncharacterized protein (TIGR04255 family)